MSQKIRVIQCGLGDIGSGVVRLMLERGNFEFVGAIDKSEQLAGKDLGQVIGSVQAFGLHFGPLVVLGHKARLEQQGSC